MNNACSSKCQAKSKKTKKSKKLKDDSDEETVAQKQVPENENPKTDANEEKGSHGTSDKKDKKEKSIGCCTKCKSKSNKMKKSKKLIEESSDEEDVKQKQQTKNENPKIDSTEENGSHGSSDEKDEKEKSILTWRHKSTKKEKGHGKNLSSKKNGVNPPFQTARPMFHGGPNPSNRWNMYAPPRTFYPAFAKGPLYGQCGDGGGGPFQPHQSMNPATMYKGARISPFPPMTLTMYNGVHMSPYPPMAAPVFPPYLHSRPFTDANPMTRYTSYADNYSNYSFCFI